MFADRGFNRADKMPDDEGTFPSVEWLPASYSGSPFLVSQLLVPVSRLLARTMPGK